MNRHFYIFVREGVKKKLTVFTPVMLLAIVKVRYGSYIVQYIIIFTLSEIIGFILI